MKKFITSIIFILSFVVSSYAQLDLSGSKPIFKVGDYCFEGRNALDYCTDYFGGKSYRFGASFCIDEKEKADAAYVLLLKNKALLEEKYSVEIVINYDSGIYATNRLKFMVYDKAKKKEINERNRKFEEERRKIKQDDIVKMQTAFENL